MYSVPQQAISHRCVWIPYQKPCSTCKSRMKKKIAHLLLTEQMNILWLTPKEMKGETKMEITYRTEEDYRIPNLLPTQEPNYHLGKYASLRHSYLKNHRKTDFINLLTT
ncbi:MAG: TnpV protein, partial [Oscillospiraceae bacterium]|nr:TnpV protein [Oscillospiraceae bacterium]